MLRRDPDKLQAPEALVDITVSNAFRYALSFYSPGAFSTTKEGGFYPPTGAPFKTVTVENPDPTTTNKLQITEFTDGNVVTNSYEWIPTTQSWALVTGNGLRRETRTYFWQGSLRIETNEVADAQGQVVFRQVETYQAFDLVGVTNLIARIVDPTGARPMTNQWVYSNTGLLLMTVGPNGSWERYEYANNGALSNTIDGVGDVLPNAPAALCRVTTTSLDSSTFCTTTITRNLGQEVARQYRYNYADGTKTIVCQIPGAAIDDPHNLVTLTLWNTDGPFAGQTSSVQNPDGTLTLYNYANSSDGLTKTTITLTGAADESGGVVDGTRTVTVADQAGHVLTNRVYDIASNLLIAQDITTQVDALGRPTVVVHLDGTNTTSYGCCGVDSQTDQTGVQTTYTYDALKRVSSTTQASITTANVLDPQGKVLSTLRNGVQTSAATYDMGGRQVTSTDGLMNTTSYSESLDASGHLVKTTTYPNGTTQIQTYFKDGTLLSSTGTAVHGGRYQYGVDANGQFTKTIKLNSDGSDSQEWTENYTDFLGRQSLVVYSDGASSSSYYNDLGQLQKQVDPDGVTTLYQYNGKGELEYSAIDMDRNDTIDYSGTDRITQNQKSVVSAHGTTVQRTTTTVWTTAGSGATLTMGVSDMSVDGLQTWQISFGLTNFVASTIDRANVRRTVTTTAPDGSYTVSISNTGRVTSVTRYDASNVQLSAVNYQYDAAGRQTTATDARTGLTTTTYNNADQQTSVSVGGQTTAYQYDNLGRVTTTTLPDSGQVFVAYWPTGEIATNWGTRTYPVAYTYDYAGRQKTMTTWQNFAGNAGAATTTWSYDAQRGFLISKQYADGAGPSYTYTAAGRLLTRTWARGIVTTYAYNNAGELGAITYSDGTTPNVSYTFDRRGRRAQAVDGAGAHLFTYNDAGQLLTESFPNSGVTVTNFYDSLLRRTNLTSPDQSVSYGYDNASRLATVSDGTHSVTYTYLSNSALVSNSVFATSGATKTTTTKNYDGLNRLTVISSQTAAGSPVSYNYTYNSANQRTQRTDADGSYWQYGYDTLGQVTSGLKKWSDGGQVAGQQYGYAFDDIGNRKSATVNGDTGVYSVNALNQYTQRTIPSTVWELGSAASNTTVTINNQPVSRHGNYFAKGIIVNNSSSTIYTQLTTVAVARHAGTNQQDVVTQSTGSEFLPKSPELFGYDSDGNLTNDGRFAYTWDAENRLIGATTAILAVTAGTPQQNLAFAYDSQSRRVSKVVSNWTGSSWVCANNLRFAYDGWNLLTERNATNGFVRSYVWGLDLSGSLQGAGGIGGLLAANLGTNGVHFVTFDGNGNVAALVNANSGSISGQYEYGPFGEVVKSTGPMAKANPLRFSTKYQDDETGLLYYGYRYYQPVTGRWPSRDPIQEVGTINLYEFARNKPISSIDAHGLCCSIKEFKINITGWAGGWPSWNWWGFSYTKLLNVQFQLTLNPCGKKEDCVIDQLKKGQVVRGGVLTGDFPSLVFDGDGAWWDGSSFKYGGGGWSEQTATWEDTPGFMNLKASDFPVHYDVQFRTRVKDKCSGFGVIAEIGWHLAVDFDTPTSGSYGYSY